MKAHILPLATCAIMELLAEVFVNIPIKSISKSYTYIIPERYSFTAVGCRAIVPFGGRKVEGFVTQVKQAVEQTTEHALKEIIEVLDIEPYFPPKVLQTAQYISEHYFCSLGEALRLFIPGKNSVSFDEYYTLSAMLPTSAEPLAKEIYEFVEQAGGCDRTQMRHKFKACAWEKVVQQLCQKKILHRELLYQENGRKLYETVYALAPLVTKAFLDGFPSKRKAQLAALLYLQEHGARTRQQLRAAGISDGSVRQLKTAGLLQLSQKQIYRDSYANEATAAQTELVLTEAQNQALTQIAAALLEKKAQTFLLHGITGSGKTQIYLETAQKSLAQQRQALILVPEIVLTGQLVAAAKKYFGRKIAVIHSRLTVGERNDTFLRIRTGRAQVIIGARSALFAPFADLGAIIMDEEHDSSYKQDEAPRYHTRDVAQAMAHLYAAVLLLGSATPSIESYQRALQGEYTLLELPQRIDNRPLPQIRCVDMREELRLGNRKVLSRALQQLIQSTLAKKEQMIIMLNRRGFSTFVMCRSCGYVAKCPDCGLPFVYHQLNGKSYLQCHHCDIRAEVPTVCPACGSKYIKFFGTGTEKLEGELREMYPSARVIRLDRDTTTKKFAHAAILRQFREHEYDILLGTQMVAKGHDIPNVTAVGIISADAGLNLPDFRAAERCFDLITQTAGRAGRGTKHGEVIIQTYNPEHYAVQLGIKQDYGGFYRAELPQRKMFRYPPYAQLIKLTVQADSDGAALQRASELRKAFKAAFPADKLNEIIGPAPARIAILRGIYRYNLLIKTQQFSSIADFLKQEKLTTDNKVQIDVNPLDIF